MTTPATLLLTARLSGSISSLISIVYMVLCTIGIIMYFNCDAEEIETANAAQHFWATVYTVYLQSEKCVAKVTVPDLTRSYTMFVFMAITLSFSMLSLITSIILTGLINNMNLKRYRGVIVYSYVGVWLASLVVDLTLASHLGIDITHLTGQLSIYAPNVLWETTRHGAFYLMSISLKGYTIHAIQLVLIVLLIFYFHESIKKEENSHRMLRAINAFDQPRRNDESLNSTHDTYTMDTFYQGNMNNTFVIDNGSSPQHDIYNKSIRQADSSSNTRAPASNMMPRPFSYLEEIRRPPLLRSTAGKQTPAPPRLPAVDYSPHSPRRLKSALKPNYNS